MWSARHQCGDDATTHGLALCLLDANPPLFDHPAMRHPTLRAWLPLASLALLACASGEPSRSLYQWTDADGSVRYTAFPERIPSSRASTRRVVEAGATARQNASAPRPGFESEVPPPQAPASASASAPGPGPATPAAHPLDARIAELEQRIETDEDTLKSLISDPERAAELRSSPQLREIGKRLPELQAELDALREQRAQAAGDDS